MKFFPAILAFLAASIAVSGSSNADLVRYTVTGTVAAASDTHSPSLVGGVFEMVFDIDLVTLTDGVGGADKGVYNGQVAGTFSINSGANVYAGTLVNGGTSETLEINNKNSADEISLDYDFAGPNMDFGGSSLTPDRILIHLKGPSSTFNSDVPDPSLSGTWWNDVVNSKIEFGNNRDLVLDIQGFSAQNITAVPEPTALPLLSLLALGAFRRRRN